VFFCFYMKGTKMLGNLPAKWLRILLLVLLAILGTPAAAQTTPPPTFPLAEPGAYTVGLSFMHVVDASRDNRALDISVWYPALVPDNPDKKQRILGQPGEWGWVNALPDTQAGPYPLIIYSPGLGMTSADRRTSEVLLASHGYVVVGLTHPNDSVPTAFVDRPLDVVFILDQLAAITTGDFAGMIDTNNVGMMGDSFGAYTTLIMTGARIDPTLAVAIDATPYVSGNIDDPRSIFPDWSWNKIAAYPASQSLPLVGAPLSSPISDARIHAAVMNSPCWSSLFGVNGLSSATVPSLIVGGTLDTICSYQHNAVYDFTNLGSPDRYVLSLIKSAHVPGLSGLAASPTNQLLVAFFDKYLQGKSDDAQYLTSDYVQGIEDQLKLGLFWGPYSGS
jgi:predicted dienelactone hydrolase